MCTRAQLLLFGWNTFKFPDLSNFPNLFFFPVNILERMNMNAGLFKIDCQEN